MEKFKVKVTNRSEVLEIEKTLSTIGMVSSDYSGFSYPKYIANNIDGEFSDYTMTDSGIDNFKSITIQELRDMVNHMKEYLEKQADGSYKLVMRGIVGKDGDIEVPEGAEVATMCGNYIIFWKDEKYSFSVSEENKWCYKSCDDSSYFSLGEYMNEYGDVEVIWQRHTQPEELPFMDSINDQYAEIEQVRQAIKVESGSDSDHSLDAMSFGFMGISEDTSHARKHRHYFKDVSNIAEIDVYAVLKLFDVTDPCLQHIVKKALCAGKRGHKDMMEDLQNIADTAIRAVELNS